MTIAEHAVALLLTINRRIHRAYNRVREGNFSIEGLMGFDLHGKTIGVVGTGRIGICVCRILAGFGCRLLASDIQSNAECLEMGVQYVDLPTLMAEADVITLRRWHAVAGILGGTPQGGQFQLSFVWLGMSSLGNFRRLAESDGVLITQLTVKAPPEAVLGAAPP